NRFHVHPIQPARNSTECWLGVGIEYRDRYGKEKDEIEGKLVKLSRQVSNLDDSIGFVIKFALELHLKWVSADYNTKQRIQFLLFPQGLSYCKKTDECRTTRINSVFLYISYFQQIISNKKRGIPELGLDYSSFEHLVHTKGIEDEQLSISFFCHPVLL